MKIAFLGNSLVEGSYGGSFVAHVAAQLPRHTIINAGQNGNTIFNLLARLDTVLEQQPDAIMVFCGGNDAISYSQPDTRRYYERVMKVPGGVVMPDPFRTAFRDLLTRIQAAQILAYAGLSPVEHNPTVVEAMRQYNAIIAEVCDSLNVPTIDLMSALNPPTIPNRPALNQATINLIGQRVSSGWQDYETERQRGGYTYSFDGLHLTPQAAEKVAGMVVEFLDL
ncbi:MAG: SGNH/GDSL hydrolase family protein [Chloroflexi bacterium]|nr:SGNH/GDSL hydrolase family protein [Chloroflexota bacterium]MCC6892557.1 SGNH/GDSL hydrolase family protein [Anaerolineae bacterium]